MKKILSLLLTICLFFTTIPAFTTKASAVSNDVVASRIDELYSLLGGKYFNKGQDIACGEKSSNHGCSNCDTAQIIKQDWFKNIFGTISPSQLGSTGKSCVGFAWFAGWYIFRADNNDTVDRYEVKKNLSLNYENISKYAKPGDYLWINGHHAAILINYDSSNVTVLDCNWGNDAGYNCMVQKHSISYSGKVNICRFYSVKNGKGAVINQQNPGKQTIEYFPCNTIISCFNGQTVNLYRNPGDNSRVTFFSKGQTVKSTRGATLSDGSKWYEVTANYGGSSQLFWLKYDSNKITCQDIKKEEPIQQYNVILDNGTSCRQITVTNGSTYGDLGNPTRDGYIFDGWYTQKSGGTRITSSTTVNLTGSQTLYAHWEKDNTTSPHDCDYIDDVCSICGAILSSDNGFDSSVAGKYVVIADIAYVRTGPYQSKSEVYRLNRWGEVDVVGSVINSYGNMWLKTSDGYYTHADKLERVVEQPQKTEIIFNGLTTPGNLTVGKGGHIDGSITSSNSPICFVKAEVCDSSGNVYLTASSSNFSRSTYGPIKDSRIDNKLTFGKLPAGDYYIKYTVTTEDNTTASAKTSVFSVFNANNYDAVNGSSTTSDPGANTFSSTINYWNCNTIISCFNGQTVNLYNNPGDSSRVTYFSKGQTAKSTRGATLSDGSIWYSVTVNHKGTNKLLWLKYDSSKMSYTDISN